MLKSLKISSETYGLSSVHPHPIPSLQINVESLDSWRLHPDTRIKTHHTDFAVAFPIELSIRHDTDRSIDRHDHSFRAPRLPGSSRGSKTPTLRSVPPTCTHKEFAHLKPGQIHEARSPPTNIVHLSSRDNAANPGSTDSVATLLTIRIFIQFEWLNLGKYSNH